MAKKQKPEDGLKVQSFHAENYKSITNITFDTQGGKSFQVIGCNGAGKSSLLQVMLANMDSKLIPSKPIKAGEERAVIEVTLAGDIDGEHRKFVIQHFFTPGNQRGRLVVEDENGVPIKSPANTIKQLMGDAGFNLIKDFLNADKKTRIKTLRKLTGKEVELDLADMAIAAKTKEKATLKTRIEDAEASLRNHGFSDEDIDKYSEIIPIEPIQQELAKVGEAMDNYNRVINGMAKMSDDVQKLAARNIAIEEEIEELQKEMSMNTDSIAAYKDNIVKGEAWLKGKEKPSAEAIAQKMSDANTHNNNCEKVKEFGEKQLDIINKKKEMDKLEQEIKKQKAAKDKIISESDLNIEGLSFDDDEILYNSLPLEEGQLNTAKLIDIGISIYASLNPNLRVIFIPEGSLLDSKTMKSIEDKWIVEKGFQIIVERVQDNETAEIHFLEERVDNV